MTATTTSWSQHALSTLAREGYRPSSARTAVIDALAAQQCCRSAREIADTLRDDGRAVGIASVYRALELLDRMRLVQRLDTGEGTTRYEPAHPSGEHHHHLVCDDCGEVTAFSDPRLEREIHRVSESLAYDVQAHDVVLRGVCADCKG